MKMKEKLQILFGFSLYLHYLCIVIQTSNLLKHLLLLAIALLVALPTEASGSPKIKYPGGRFYIYRYTLSDKLGTPYSIDHPLRWLSAKSVERRKRQGLAIDSTDLPVSTKYLRAIEKKLTEGVSVWKRDPRDPVIIGTSRWNNTVLVRSADTTVLNRVAQLDFVKEARCVWTAPDSIDKSTLKVKIHEEWNPWDSVKNEPYGQGKEQIEMLQGHRLHHIGKCGKGMTIAVLDGGFQNVDKIPAMRHISIAGTHDFVYPHSPAFYNETDHGTKVLSALAAQERGVLVGTAPEARYWLLRCEDQQSEQPVEEDYWAMAAEFADSVGADIINSSLGYQEYDKHRGDYHQRDLDGQTALISRTASMLAAKGIVLVNSAGNLGMGPWKKITFPADARDILTVGALNNHKENAPFSGIGPTQDGRVKPDVMALGSPACLISGRGTIIRDMGTSFSTPVVAGLVACLWQAMPEMKARDIIRLVRESCPDYLQPDNIHGYGIPNFWKAYMVGRMRSGNSEEQRSDL